MSFTHSSINTPQFPAIDFSSNSLYNSNLFNHIYNNKLFTNNTASNLTTTSNSNNNPNMSKHVISNQLSSSSSSSSSSSVKRKLFGNMSIFQLLAYTMLSVSACGALFYYFYLKRKWNKNNIQYNNNYSNKKIDKIHYNNALNDNNNINNSIDIHERELVCLLLQSMDNLQSTGLISGPLEQSLYVWLLSLDLYSSSIGLRILSVQWLLLYITMEGMLCNSKANYDKFQLRIINKDLQLGLKLLSNVNCNNRAAELLKLELIQRTRNYKELSSLLDNYLKWSSNKQLSYEEVVLLFTSLPLIGRWKEFVILVRSNTALIINTFTIDVEWLGISTLH
jgi:hypothetical protein